MHIVFVGFGAVGFVLIQMLEEYARNAGKSLRYSLIVRREGELGEELKSLKIEATVVVAPDMMTFLKEGVSVGSSVDRTINVATPLFNLPTMTWCLQQGSNYMDLASNITPDDIVSGTLEQHTVHEQFKQHGLLAVINAGISPGITELVTGYGIHHHGIVPKQYTLLLRENFVANVALFSRSPSVAIDEMLTPALVIDAGVVDRKEPFTLYHDKDTQQKYYLITQEESSSIYRAYHYTLQSMLLATGGAEVESVKGLYILGLLSSEKVGDTTYLAVVKSKMPRASGRQDVITAIENNQIEEATFGFDLAVNDETQRYRVHMNLDTEAFMQLNRSPYYGSTTVSYATGVGAGALFALVQSTTQTGVVNCLELGLSVSTETVTMLIHTLRAKGLEIDTAIEPTK